MKICVVCGDPLTGRQARYCKPLCASRGFNQARSADGRLKAYHEKNAVKRAAWQRENAHRYKGRYSKDVYCRTCGEKFTTAYTSDRIYCDEACRALTTKRRKPRSRRITALAKLKRAALGTSGRNRGWVEGPCRRCGERFMAVSHGPSLAAYCSNRCLRGDIKERYNARRRGAEIGEGSRFAVYVRDGWMCQICGDPVSRTSCVPELDAAVIDHRIPLARGGAHREDNWQTAHFYCNSVKQDTDLDIRAA